MKNSTKKMIFLLVVMALIATLALALAACNDKDAQTQTPSTGDDDPSIGEDTPSTDGNTTAIGTEFTVTLDVGGCKPLEKTEFTVQFGKPYQLPVPKPANEIYTEFLGWAYNGIRISASDGSISNWNIEQNATLKAEFGGCVLHVADGVIVGHSDKIALVSDLVIPSEINGQKITSIGDYAFENCRTLISVSIPSGVTNIGKNAFYGCVYISEVIFLGSLKEWCEMEFGDQYANPLCWDYNVTVFGGDIEFDRHLYIKDGEAQKEVKGDVDIPDGTKKIGNYAFYEYLPLASVTIPDSVKSIGDSAFFDCTGITSVTIPGSVTSIGESAFYYCTSLQTVTLGEGVQNIGGGAFLGCTSLSGITIPSSVQEIGASAFSGCYELLKVNVESLKAWCEIKFENDHSNPLLYGDEASTAQGIIIGGARLYLNGEEVTEIKDIDGVETIPAYAFIGCDKIGSVVIPDSVRVIGNYAFYGCTGLSEIVIPDGVQSIDRYAFSACTGLSEITIPDSMTSIGDRAFYNCTGLQAATIKAQSIGASAFSGCTGLHTATINAQSIGDYAFVRCLGLETVTIGEGVQEIGYGAFSDCQIITKVNYLGTLKGWCGIDFGNSNANPLRESSNAKLFLNDEEVTEIKDLDGLKSISNYAFAGFQGITSVVIANGVASIGEGAFSACTNLSEITIPISVTNIGEYAFNGSYGITKVYYLGTLKSWCGIEFGNSYANPLYGAKLYLNDEEVTEIKDLEGLQSIPNYAFNGIEGITSVVIPNSVTHIGENSFFYCTDITSVVIPDSVQKIGNSAFYGCTKLRTVTIGKNVTSIGDGAFSDCTGLQSVTIGNGVQEIGHGAFYGCTGLTEITIPNGVTSIGEKAFSLCTGLTEITIPDSVTSIGDYAFSGCTGLQSVTIGNGVQEIAYGAFNDCRGLQTVTIGKGVTSIGREAFCDCKALKDIYYAGDETEWENIKKGQQWDQYYYGGWCTIDYQLHYNSTGPENASGAR